MAPPLGVQLEFNAAAGEGWRLAAEDLQQHLGPARCVAPQRRRSSVERALLGRPSKPRQGAASSSADRQLGNDSLAAAACCWRSAQLPSPQPIT
jgi:hypothetical protein